MKKIFQILLLALLIVTLSIDFKVFAKLSARHSGSASSIATTVKKSISSIIKGTVDLISPRTLKGSLRSIYIGNGNRLALRKRIKVKGNFSGSHISLHGLKATGDGYEFAFNVPGSLYSARNRFTRHPESSIRISYATESLLSEDLKINVLKGVRSRKGQTISGTFSKRTSRGTAKGRFILKLHRNAFM